MSSSNSKVRTRPVLVWLFLVFSIYTFADFAFSMHRGYIVTSKGRLVSLNEPASMKTFRAAVATLQLIAAVQLFRLRISSVALLELLLAMRVALSALDIRTVLNLQSHSLLASSSC
jgi:hypothetical protein